MGIAGRLIDMAEAALLTEAEVAAVDGVGDDFVRVDLVAPAFRAAKWAAGAKVQIRPPGAGRGLRTFTPTSWDMAEGRTSLLAYLHGDGPASAWFRRVQAGDRVKLMGPRRSIEPPAAGERVLFVGDATSVALAQAFETTGAALTCLFEAERPQALEGLRPGAEVCEPTALLDRLRAAGAGMAGPYRLVATGNAATVHAVRREIRTWSAPPAKVTGKAYWAAGRTGLD
ncbi:siderophore-interacting protein [Dactylosporangium sp. NPDC006015]|uniref:siderophore-interacting protein n=1 Tax=Dactylosporangium sp. NPDC006015 TaxID=3154576 RepID=UPI0033B9E736